MKKQKPLLQTYWPVIVFGLLIAVSIFLRYYRIDEFITFLGDQGRDAIIMKRLITLEDFPGIGPRSSVGDLFLGPFYFYLMAPFLGLFMLNPVGPAYGVATIWIIGLIGAYFILRRLWNTRVALIFLFLGTFSWATVSLSRFSWNPNLLPLFSFFTLLLLPITLQRKHWIYAVCFGALFGASLQLHYLMLLTTPAMLIITVWYIWNNRNHWKKYLIKLIAATAGFATIFAPLIVFDLKNNFLNLRGILSIFEAEQFEAENTIWDRIRDTSTFLWEHIFQIELHRYLGLFITAAFIMYVVYYIRSQKTVPYIFATFAFSVISFISIFGFVDTQRFLHYYTPIYLSVFVVISTIITIGSKRITVAFMTLFLVAFFINNVQQYRFITAEGSNQTATAKSIASKINEISSKEPYYLVSIPLSSTNHHIRYYLEVMNNRPLPEESLDPAEELFILCYYPIKEDCRPTDDGQYQVAIFGNKEIDQVVEHPPEVTIYKIVHGER